MTRGLSSHWQNVRKYCGQWSFDGFTGSSNSSNCANANIALQANAKYYAWIDGVLTAFPITSSFTVSVTTGLWSKII